MSNVPLASALVAVTVTNPILGDAEDFPSKWAIWDDPPVSLVVIGLMVSGGMLENAAYCVRLNGFPSAEDDNISTTLLSRLGRSSWRRLSLWRRTISQPCRSPCWMRSCWRHKSLSMRMTVKHRRARWVLPSQARFKIFDCLISISSKNREFVQRKSQFEARSGNRKYKISITSKIQE